MIKYFRRWIEPERYLQRWLDPRVFSLRVADVIAYLRRKGWTSVEPDRPNVLVFQEPPGGGKELYQFVPASEEVEDYARQMTELITLLAFYEDRYAVDIVNDIVSSPDHGSANGAGQDHPASAEVSPQ